MYTIELYIHAVSFLGEILRGQPRLLTTERRMQKSQAKYPLKWEKRLFTGIKGDDGVIATGALIFNMSFQALKTDSKFLLKAFKDWLEHFLIIPEF